MVAEFTCGWTLGISWLVLSMISMHGYRVIYDARSKLDAKLSNVIKGKEWGWLPARFESLVNIQSKLFMIHEGK
jgi:hypothetical protein